jgi:hypothetical protein
MMKAGHHGSEASEANCNRDFYMKIESQLIHSSKHEDNCGLHECPWPCKIMHESGGSFLRNTKKGQNKQIPSHVSCVTAILVYIQNFFQQAIGGQVSKNKISKHSS